VVPSLGVTKGKENEAIYAGCRRLLVFASLGGARGDEFETVSQPSFAAIEARLVYGAVTYDFSFAGSNNKVRSQSATNFCNNLYNPSLRAKKAITS